MKSGSLVRVSLRLATLTLALAAGGYLLRPKPTPLPKLAAPVAIAPPVPIDAPAVADGWAHLVQAKIEPITFPGYSVRDTDAYDWLPDGRVLFARYADKTGHYELFTASASGITPLREFNRKRRHNLYADRYLSPGGYMDHLPPRISAPYCLPAPDGNQILWLEDSEIYVSVGDTPRRPDAYAVASLDGRTQREWHYWAIAPNWNQEAGFFGPDACWMRDSRHWVTPYFKQGLWAGFAVIDARRPHSWRVTRFRSTLDDNYHLLGESQDGSILAESWSAGEAGGESILRFRPDAPVATPEAIALRPPLSGAMPTVRLSPQVNKLAWLIFKDNRLALWISSSSGKFPGLSAPIAVPASLDTESLRWLPDGRHISFLQGETLYKVTLP